jgi:AcrR family transcriptional regulator
MALPPQIAHVCDKMRTHLSQFDWSAMTNGRRQILAAFLKLAIAQGYGAVTMRGLAQAVDVKAASIYFHFPGGRDEIVGETLRWHYYNWGTAILQTVESSRNAEEFWDSLVRAHVQRQIELPESDLWDIFVATNRVYGFLRKDFHDEILDWLDLCTRMYEAAALEMGYDVGLDLARAVMKLIDNVSSWYGDAGPDGGSEVCIRRTIAITRAMLSCERKIVPTEPAV